MSVIRLRTLTQNDARYLALRLTSPTRLERLKARPRPTEGRERNSAGHSLESRAS